MFMLLLSLKRLLSAIREARLKEVAVVPSKLHANPNYSQRWTFVDPTVWPLLLAVICYRRFQWSVVTEWTLFYKKVGLLDANAFI